MATADKLVYLDETKDLLREVINTSGGALTELDPFREYVDPILWGWLVLAYGGLDLDYINERYRIFDPAYNALVEKPWADIVNNYSAPAGRTYFDSSGVLQTAGTDEPIRAFDPATGEFLGNQIWGSYRNKYDYSLDFVAAGWARQNCAFAANVITAPNGTLTGGKLTENTSNSNHRLSSPTYAGSGLHEGSFIVKAGERTRCMLFLFDGIQRRGSTIYDLSVGEVVPGYGSGTIEDLGGGWYRVKVRTSELAGSSVQAFLSIVYATTDSYFGDGSSGIYVWNSMLDDKALGPEIITTGAPVTIAAESQIIDSTVFADMWNAGAGTLFIECEGAMDAVALKAAGVEVVVDSASNKKYAVAYTSDPSATSLIIGANLNGYIRRITYFRKELSASLMARLIA
tara:strand:+ start:1639 stop:2838 length:1200 start_codon:yes stop_codon:yes gene_type:complete